jgi:hypothetical protein
MEPAPVVPDAVPLPVAPASVAPTGAAVPFPMGPAPVVPIGAVPLMPEPGVPVVPALVLPLPAALLAGARTTPRRPFKTSSEHGAGEAVDGVVEVQGVVCRSDGLGMLWAGLA